MTANLVTRRRRRRKVRICAPWLSLARSPHRRAGKEKKEKKKSTDKKDPALKSSSTDVPKPTIAVGAHSLTAVPAGKYEVGKQVGGITLGCVPFPHRVPNH